MNTGQTGQQHSRGGSGSGAAMPVQSGMAGPSGAAGTGQTNQVRRMNPTIGCIVLYRSRTEDYTVPAVVNGIVLYRSRTGDYTVPAVVNCTTATIYQPGVDAGHVPPLSSDEHVHLTVFTPGKQGMRQNQGGSYQEWNVPRDDSGVTPGSWCWPARLGGTA